MHWADVWRRGCHDSNRPRTCWVLNVLFLLQNIFSSLLTAVAFLCFPTCYCRQWVTAQCSQVRDWLRYSFGQSFSKHLHSIRVANIKWVYISSHNGEHEATINSGSELSHALLCPTFRDTSAMLLPLAQCRSVLGLKCQSVCTPLPY